MAPPVVIFPIFRAKPSVNQSAPSGPAVIGSRPLKGVGTGYSVKAPAVVMRPILLAMPSVNQRAPSGPAAIPYGLPLACMKTLVVGTGYSVMLTDTGPPGEATVKAAALDAPPPGAGLDTITADDAMNPLPLIVSVSGLLPAEAEEGDRFVIVGLGLLAA